MSDDMEIIEQIEKQIGKELELWQFENIVSAFGNGYSLDKVGQVKGLNLDDIEIKDISFLESLGGLTHLLLRRDQISDLTPLSALKNLTELSLGSNQITDLTPLRELKKLEQLDVRNNLIQKLPPEITTWWPDLEMKWDERHDIKGLNLCDNPLTDPPIEIVQKGNAAIKNYFDEIQQASVLFLESKLLLVGSGDVGKTTLMKKLKDNEFVVVPGKEDTTRGIDIQPWQETREALTALDLDYIPLIRYLSVCIAHGMNREKALFLSDYLHDLGIILHFSRDPVLADTVILKPGWATGAVYALIDSLEIQKNKGRFNRAHLGRYWKPPKYPEEKYPQLLRLIEKFELCFNIVGTDDYILPELLPTQRPALDMEAYRSAGNLHFHMPMISCRPALSRGLSAGCIT